MKIYIASSWKREDQHEVVSWIENCNLEGSGTFVFEDWVNTPEAEACFKFDIDGATTCDLFIYYGASGMDACCEMGAAWAKGIEIIALYSKGESLGLMRKMVTTWLEDYRDVLKAVKVKQKSILPIVPANKPANYFVSLDFNGTEKIHRGQFTCKQCATKQVMNADCISILNQIQESIQVCGNCGYDNLFTIKSLVNTGSNEES